MVFDGLKKLFNMIGGVTIDSSRKVGEGVQKPVNKLSNLKSPLGKFDNMKSISTKRFTFQKTPPRAIERMRMDKDEIQMFKELIDKKHEKKDKSKEEKANTYRKAALEEILKEEEKKETDPKLIIGMGAVSFVVVMVLMVGLGFGIEAGLGFGMLMMFMAGFIVFLPKLRSEKRLSEASRELPFALRQMATELRAGLGLHESMRSVAMSGYGPLSEEFARTLEEIRYGETTENALIDLSERINSEGLKRAIHQITRTLSSGGNLSQTLNVIAEDTAYEMRMKSVSYTHLTLPTKA